MKVFGCIICSSIVFAPVMTLAYSISGYLINHSVPLVLSKILIVIAALAPTVMVFILHSNKKNKIPDELVSSFGTMSAAVIFFSFITLTA